MPAASSEKTRLISRIAMSRRWSRSREISRRSEAGPDRRDRGGPPVAAEPRDPAGARPSIDTGPAPRRVREEVLPTDDDAPAPPGRARDWMELRLSLGVGHGAAFSHGFRPS